MYFLRHYLRSFFYSFLEFFVTFLDSSLEEFRGFRNEPISQPFSELRIVVGGNIA